MHGVNLFLDKDGSIDLPYDAKFPVILPRNNLITQRIIEHFHVTNLHENTQTVINDIRQRYLIKRSRTLINKLQRMCLWCRVNKAKPKFPQMAEHPTDRLAFRKKAFHSIGIDLFGPILTINKRSSTKRWGVLFTCLTTRAVHLELAHSLSGESCKMSIENFINRRGVPNAVRSDNGTNLVWAAKNYRDHLGRPLNWKFIPPGAPA